MNFYDVCKSFGVDSQSFTHCLKKSATYHGLSEEKCLEELGRSVDEALYDCIRFKKGTDLFDYQEEVVSHLFTHRGIITAFATGTGKTLTAIASAACLHSTGKLFGKAVKVLIVTPASLVDNMKEAQRAYPYNFGKSINIISSNLFRDALVYDHFVKNPVTQADPRYQNEKIWKQHQTFMRTKAKHASLFACDPNTFLIIDEAHEFKSDYQMLFDDSWFSPDEEALPRAKVFMEFCAPRAWKLLLMTATPMLNRWYDIINLLAAVRGVETSVLQKEITMKPLAVKITDPNTIDVLRIVSLNTEVPVIGQKYLDAYKGTVVFKDVDSNNSNFPRRALELYMKAEMSSSYFEAYEALTRETPGSRKKRSDAKKEEEKLVSLQKKVALLEGNPKIPLAIELIRIGGYYKVLIYSRYLIPLRKVKEALENAYPSHSSFIITGEDIAPNKRQAYLQEINHTNKAFIFVSDAGGMGLDFKRLGAVIIYEPGVNRSREEQAIGRAIRFRSHTDLPPKKQKVDIFRLIMRYPKEHSGHETVDQRIAITALKKEVESNFFKQQLQSLS